MPMASDRHGVPTGQIYSQLGDAGYQATDVETPGFTPVDVSDAPARCNRLLGVAIITGDLHKETSRHRHGWPFLCPISYAHTKSKIIGSPVNSRLTIAAHILAVPANY